MGISSTVAASCVGGETSARRLFLSRLALWVAVITCASCGGRSSQEAPRAGSPVAANVDAARILAADKDPGNWLTHGRTYSEQRFSPLAQINEQNVNRLGLAWYFDVDTNRGQEATPLVVDGVMYFTTAWSKVVALDAASGSRLWLYDPRVPPAWGINACCDVVN